MHCKQVQILRFGNTHVYQSAILVLRHDRLTHLSRMELVHLSVHFRFKGVWVFSILIQFIVELKQLRPWSGSALFADV